jgi:proline iminopeptidase
MAGRRTASTALTTCHRALQSSSSSRRRVASVAAALTGSGADLRYVSPPSSDAADFVAEPLQYPVQLYPEIEPYSTGTLDAGAGHRVYYEESGKSDGIPALFLHGGPGGGCSPRSRQFFDPSVYRIVCLDQRGCGRSTPNAADDWQAALVENNTAALVADCEAIRQALGIEQWGLVLGGSWGSTLALALAEAHPSTIRSLLLRGVFLFGPDEVDYLFSSGGTFGQHPQAWAAYCRFIEDTSTDWERERTNLLGAYYQRLTSGDPAMQNAAASAFVGYELSISKTFVDPASIEEELATPSALIPFALFEVVYMINGGFMRRGQLLDGCTVLKDRGIKVRITHGRADYVCQPQAAYRLASTLEGLGIDVTLEFVAGAGHSDSEPGLVDAMVRATDSLAKELLQ